MIQIIRFQLLTHFDIRISILFGKYKIKYSRIISRSYKSEQLQQQSVNQGKNGARLVKTTEDQYKCSDSTGSKSNVGATKTKRS